MKAESAKMLRIIFLYIILIANVVSGFFLDAFGLSSKVQVVSELDVNKYLGRWYQMYASQSVYATFEQDALCVTADYTQNTKIKNNITVLNAETLNKPGGPFKIIHGYALPTSEVGKLTVQLETVPFAAPYWVLRLGPKTFGPDDQYQYSIVSDYLKATLFVLARDPSIFKDFEAEILQFLEEEGFTSFINKPIKTYHDSDCKYYPP